MKTSQDQSVQNSGQHHPVQNDQEQLNALDIDTLLHPDLTHRYGPLTYGTTISNLADYLDFTALRANSVLSLIRSQFAENFNSLKYDQIYYSFAAVKMDVDDIRAVTNVYRAGTAQTELDFLPELEGITLRTGGVLSLLCDRFLNDDMPQSNHEVTVGAIDSILLELGKIEPMTRDSRIAMRTGNRA